MSCQEGNLEASTKRETDLQRRGSTNVPNEGMEEVGN